MIVHLKIGVYSTGRDEILCHRFMPKSTPKTTTERDKVTCGLCLHSLLVLDRD